MTPMEAEAMLIRHSAAMRIVETCDEPERWELLNTIVSPSPTALEASMEMAERVGPSNLAKKIARVSLEDQIHAGAVLVRQRQQTRGPLTHSYT